MQVRTGPGAQTPFRGGKIEGTDEAIAQEIKGVLEQLKGEVGERKRSNALDVRKMFVDAAKPGGGSWNGLRELVNFGSADSQTTKL